MKNTLEYLNLGFDMMWRVLKSKKGFTLTEMIVVMAITSILLLLSFQGYFGVKQNIYTQEIGVRLQYEARNTFVNSISTTAGTICTDGTAPKVWALRIPLRSGGDFRTIQLISYCEDNTLGTHLLKRNTVNSIDLSDNLTYGRDMRSSLIHCLDGSNKNDGYSFDTASGVCKNTSGASRSSVEVTNGAVYLLYNTPYGDFFSFWDRTDTNYDVLPYTPYGTDFNSGFIEQAPGPYWTTSNSPSKSFEPPICYPAFGDNCNNYSTDAWLNRFLTPLASDFVIKLQNPSSATINIQIMVYKSGGVELR